MKSKEEITWLIYDVFDDEPVETKVRDVAVNARLELKREVFEVRTFSVLLDNRTTIETAVSEPFLEE